MQTRRSFIQTVIALLVVPFLPKLWHGLPDAHQLYISPEAMEDIKRWSVIDEQTRKEIYYG